MAGPLLEQESGPPEMVVDRLLGRLQRHALWDSLLFFVSPLLASLYLAFFLLRSAWLTREALIFAMAGLLGTSLLLAIRRQRALAPSARAVARLIDDRVAGKDRFVTLATIDPALCPLSLLARLRREAAGLLHRIDPKTDFPYRVKRSFFVSALGSLAVILLFHLLWQSAFFFTPRAPSLKEIALELSRLPRLSQLARDLEALAVRMERRDLSVEQKRSLIQEMLQKVENQLAAGRKEGGAPGDLLSQAADVLGGLAQGMEQSRGGGGGQSSSRPGERRESGEGRGGKGQGELSASGDSELKRGESIQGETQAAGKKESKGDQDKGIGDKERQRSSPIEGGGTAKGDLERKGVRDRGEEIPRGAAPERFLKPGEQGEKGIEGARFVTVELPQGAAQGSGGEGGPGKSKGLQPKVPVSNLPLRPPDSPEASREKQPLPLEYRGLIR